MCACGQISCGGQDRWSRLPQLKWPNAAAETVSSVLLSVAVQGGGGGEGESREWDAGGGVQGESGIIMMAVMPP